jgi:hypothetical protein
MTMAVISNTLMAVFFSVLAHQEAGDGTAFRRHPEAGCFSSSSISCSSHGHGRRYTSRLKLHFKHHLTNKTLRRITSALLPWVPQGLGRVPADPRPTPGRPPADPRPNLVRETTS